jgi:hypothetical protein
MGNAKNPINAKNFTAVHAETRRAELQKARQNFQQNSFLVDSPVVVYYQQVRHGHVCTCHAIEHPVEPSEKLNNIITAPELTNFSDKVTEISFSTLVKTPMFGSLPAETVKTNGFNSSEDDLLLDDSDEPETTGTSGSLFGQLFHKGTDCGICFRSGYTPLLQPIGRQFYALTSHNYEELSGYHIDQTKSPNIFSSNTMLDSYVEFKVKVPKYFKTVSYAIYNNTTTLTNELYVHGTDTPLTNALLNVSRGSEIHLQVREVDFTHVFIEFDLGIETRANFPQFSISKDYSYFLNLQQVTIELPPTMNNAQVNDFIYVQTWDRLFQIFDIQPKYEGPLQTVLLGTTVQGRLVQPVETARILTKLKQLKK